MGFLFKNSLLVQEAWKIAAFVNREARKQRLKRKQACKFSYPSNNQPTLIVDILFPQNKQKVRYSS